MARQVEAARRFPDGYRMLSAQASVAGFQGQLMLLRELVAQYESEVAANTGLKGSAAVAWSNVAQVAALYGDAAAARSIAQHAIGIEHDFTTEMNSAFALAFVGDDKQARALIDAAAARPEASNEDSQRGLKALRATVRMARHEPGFLEDMPSPRDAHDMGEICLLGLANLEAGNSDAAAERFKQVVDWQEPSTSSLYALAPLYYGRALVKLERMDEARQAYQRFFDTFKLADTNLPILTAAKREFSRLTP
jgi:Flp pilus assembly protein TadD